jgi:ABC-type Mn2+/Zn2+ transport system ATPase subunit
LHPMRSLGPACAISSDNTTEDAPVFIGVVGVTGSGKSSLIKRVTGCDNVVVFDGLRSGNSFKISFISRLTSMLRNWPCH